MLPQPLLQDFLGREVLRALPAATGWHAVWAPGSAEHHMWDPQHMAQKAHAPLALMTMHLHVASAVLRSRALGLMLQVYV